jgi:hypothetical protein
VDAKVYTLPKLHQSSRILQSQQTKESLLLGPPIAPTILPRKSQVPISRATVQVLFLRFHISGKRVYQDLKADRSQGAPQAAAVALRFGVK